MRYVHAPVNCTVLQQKRVSITMLVIMAVYRLLNIKIKAKTSYDSYLAYFDI